MPVISGVQISGDESGHHGIPCAHGIFYRALCNSLFMHLAVLRYQDGSVLCHGHQHVHRSHVLKLSRILHNLLICGQFCPKHLPQLMVIGLDQKRMIL